MLDVGIDQPILISVIILNIVEYIKKKQYFHQVNCNL